MNSKKVKKRIGFDLDGVLVDHENNKIKIAQDLGYSLEIQKTFQECLRNILGESDYKKLRDILYGEVSLFADVMDDANFLLNEIKRAGYPFFLVSRRTTGRQYATEWLIRNLNFPRSNIFFVDEDRQKNAEIKKIVKELELNYFIDDKLSVLESISSDVNRFLFDQFCLRQEKKIGDIFVVHSLKEFLREIKD